MTDFSPSLRSSAHKMMNGSPAPIMFQPKCKRFASFDAVFDGTGCRGGTLSPAFVDGGHMKKIALALAAAAAICVAMPASAQTVVIRDGVHRHHHHHGWRHYEHRRWRPVRVEPRYRYGYHHHHHYHRGPAVVIRP
jgi:hypothetical protein